MSKIGIIIRREYMTRVRNKTFLLLTFLAPIFYGILIMLPVLATQIGKDTKMVEVLDESGLFQDKFPSTERAIFSFKNEALNDAKARIDKEDGFNYVLHIPKDLNIYAPEGIKLISRKNVGGTFKSYLDSLLANRITAMKMEKLNLSRSLVDTLYTRVDVNLLKETESGLEDSSSAATTAASFIGGFLIYIFIFLYGGLVLRGVQEEKQNRVVEVIVSSVRPFELMMGKIIGIALVGLSQFLLWVFITLAITSVTGQLLGSGMEAHGSQMAVAAAQDGNTVEKAMSAINTLPIPLLVSMFVFFFIGGYLLYSSLFAAAASAVDSQTDMYQFMFPISLPIILSITLIPAVIDSPDSSLAFWMSIIPFTSPVIMMARLPFDVPLWQLLLSMGILIGGFIFTTWLAGKIYRVGILMYGKKITYKELAKWIFYKN